MDTNEPIKIKLTEDDAIQLILPDGKHVWIRLNQEKFLDIVANRTTWILPLATNHVQIEIR